MNEVVSSTSSIYSNCPASHGRILSPANGDGCNDIKTLWTFTHIHIPQCHGLSCDSEAAAAMPSTHRLFTAAIRWSILSKYCTVSYLCYNSAS